MMNKARYPGHNIEEPESLGSTLGAFTLTAILVGIIYLITLIY